MQNLMHIDNTADLSTLPVLPGESRFSLLSLGLPVFYNFLPAFPCLSAEVFLVQNDPTHDNSCH